MLSIYIEKCKGYGEEERIWGKRAKYHTYPYFPAYEAYLGIAGSHFELFSFISQNLFSECPPEFAPCKLFLHMKLSVHLSIWLTNLFPSLFFGSLSHIVSMHLPRGKFSAYGLNCLEYLREQKKRGLRTNGRMFASKYQVNVCGKMLLLRPSVYWHMFAIEGWMWHSVLQWESWVPKECRAQPSVPC